MTARKKNSLYQQVRRAYSQDVDTARAAVTQDLRAKDGMRNGVHWIADDGACAICGPAQAHRTWVEAQLTRIAATPLSPWATAMKAKIDAARKGIAP
jgi:hypothetical protein